MMNFSTFRSSTRLFLPMVIILILSLTNGCRVGPDYMRPSLPIPTHFTGDDPADSTMANIPWWELFCDTVLVRLISVTIHENRDLKVAVSRIEEARSAMAMVRTDLYPRVNYSMGGASQVNTSTTGITNDYNGMVDVSYTIDVWGRVHRLSEAALQDYLATVEASRALRILLIAEVAAAYFTLRDIDSRLIISEKTAETWQSNLDIVNARYKGGFVSEVDLNQARIQLLEAHTAIQTFTRLRRITENAISQLNGNAPTAIPRGLPIEQQVFPPTLPLGVPSQLLERRPDILLAERLLRAQTERIGAAEALKYPSFTLNLGMGLNFINPVAGFASLGAQILGPIFNNKSARQTVLIETERTYQLLNKYESAFLTALREVDDAAISVKTYHQEVKLRREQLEAAQEAVKLSWIRYDGGLTSFLEVLDLQRAVFSSQLKAVEALQLELTSTVKLYQALGGGWSATDQ